VFAGIWRPAWGARPTSRSEMQRLASLSRHMRLAILALVVALLFLILWLVDWDFLWLLLRRTDRFKVLVAIPFVLASFLLLVSGWRYLLPVKLAWWEIFSVTGVSFALSSLTPFPDSALRIITTEQGTAASLTEATAALAMERLLALIMRLLAFIALVSVWTGPGADSTPVVIVRLALILAAVAAILWIVRHPNAVAAGAARLSRLPHANNLHLEETVANLASNLAQTFTVRRFAHMLILFLLIWLTSGIYHVLVLTALPIRLSPRAMVAVGLALLVILPPVVPRMIGLYQTVAITLLVALLLLNPDQAIAYAVIVQLPQVLLWLMLGAFSYRRSNLKVSNLTTQVKALLTERKSPQASPP